MICIIDFDGTFFKNDFFLEIFYKTFLNRPIYFIKLIFNKKFNKIDIKKDLLISHNINYDVDFLINNVVLKWIIENKNKYTHFYLVSATPIIFLHKILKNQTIFDEIFGSDEINLAGHAKLNFILNKWGPDFTYVGNSNADIPLFISSREAFKFTKNKIINVKSIFNSH
jgi:hypothetical protein